MGGAGRLDRENGSVRDRSAIECERRGGWRGFDGSWSSGRVVMGLIIIGVGIYTRVFPKSKRVNDWMLLF